MKEKQCLEIAHRISMVIDLQKVDDHCSNFALLTDEISVPQGQPVNKSYGLREVTTKGKLNKQKMGQQA